MAAPVEPFLKYSTDFRLEASPDGCLMDRPGAARVTRVDQLLGELFLISLPMIAYVTKRGILSLVANTITPAGVLSLCSRTNDSIG